MKTSFLATLFSFSLYVAYEKLWMSLLTISDSLFIKNVLGLFLQYKYLTQFSLNFSALVLEYIVLDLYPQVISEPLCPRQ